MLIHVHSLQAVWVSFSQWDEIPESAQTFYIKLYRVKYTAGLFSMLPNALSTCKKQKIFSVLLSYRNTSGRLGERKMLWERDPQASVSTAFSSSSNLLRVTLSLH